MTNKEEQDLEIFMKTVDKSKFKIDFFVKKVPKPWGYELIFTPEDAPYTGKLMHIEAGKRQSLQIHDEKQETYLLLSGDGFVMIEDASGEMQKVELRTDKGLMTLVGQKHRLCAGEVDCDIIEFSTPEKGNTYRLEDDYNRSTETEEARAARNADATS